MGYIEQSKPLGDLSCLLPQKWQAFRWNTESSGRYGCQAYGKSETGQSSEKRDNNWRGSKKYDTYEEKAKGLAWFSLQMTPENMPRKDFKQEGWLNTGVDCMRDV